MGNYSLITAHRVHLGTLKTDDTLVPRMKGVWEGPQVAIIGITSVVWGQNRIKLPVFVDQCVVFDCDAQPSSSGRRVSSDLLDK